MRRGSGKSDQGRGGLEREINVASILHGWKREGMLLLLRDPTPSKKIRGRSNWVREMSIRAESQWWPREKASSGVLCHGWGQCNSNEHTCVPRDAGDWSSVCVIGNDG